MKEGGARHRGARAKLLRARSRCREKKLRAGWWEGWGEHGTSVGGMTLSVGMRGSSRPVLTVAASRSPHPRSFPQVRGSLATPRLPPAPQRQRGARFRRRGAGVPFRRAPPRARAKRRPCARSLPLLLGPRLHGGSSEHATSPRRRHNPSVGAPSAPPAAHASAPHPTAQVKRERHPHRTRRSQSPGCAHTGRQ